MHFVVQPCVVEKKHSVMTSALGTFLEHLHMTFAVCEFLTIEDSLVINLTLGGLQLYLKSRHLGWRSVIASW